MIYDRAINSQECVYMEIVGQRLKALRESMGISQAKIALLLDSKQPNINRFEHKLSVILSDFQ